MGVPGRQGLASLGFITILDGEFGTIRNLVPFLLTSIFVYYTDFSRTRYRDQFTR